MKLRNNLVELAVCLSAVFIFNNQASAIIHDRSPIYEEKFIQKSVPPTQQPESKTKKKADPVTKKTRTQKKINKKPPAVATASTVEVQEKTYHTLLDWNLIEDKPSVILKKADGNKIQLRFMLEADTFIIPESQKAIPAGTRFTVPGGYVAYGNPEHTKIISGKASRVEYSPNVIKNKYEAGAIVEYIAPSGLIIASYADAVKESAAPSKNELIKTETLDLTEILNQVAKRKHEYENRSTNPSDVIKTYDISEDTKRYLINRYSEILRNGNLEERIESLTEIFAAYKEDYLAAYYIGLAEYECGHGGRAKEWLEKSLQINHRYLPAKILLQSTIKSVNRSF